MCAALLLTFAGLLQLFVWSMKTGRLLDVLSGHEGPIYGLSFSPTHVSVLLTPASVVPRSRSRVSMGVRGCPSSVVRSELVEFLMQKQWNCWSGRSSCYVQSAQSILQVGLTLKPSTWLEVLMREKLPD
jgi:WD40 repeat protein